MEASDLDKGFLVDDTLSISILAIDPSAKSSKSPAPGAKRAFALVDQAQDSHAE